MASVLRLMTSLANAEEPVLARAPAATYIDLDQRN
jgi:hypothetical protein